LTDKTALIVEDTADLATIFSDILKASGFTCEIAPDGQIAVDRLVLDAPDLVVLDLHLPLISGDQVLDFVRKQAHLKETKVVVVTADGDAGMHLLDKADLVLIKPVSPSDLRRLVERIVG
jgi:DNA-binding response OmpR family regulator